MKCKYEAIMRFTSPLLKVGQLNELFQRAYESEEFDASYGHHSATLEEYLTWASEEVLANN